MCVPPLAIPGVEDGDVPGVIVDGNIAHEVEGDENGPRVEKRRGTCTRNKEIPEMSENKLMHVGGN